MIKKILILAFAALTVNAQNTLIHHELNALIKPDASFIEVTDQITVDKSLVKDGLKFKLHHALVVEPTDMIKRLDESVDAKDIGMDIDDAGSKSSLKLDVYEVKLPGSLSGDLKFTVKYKGEIQSPIKQSKENYARGEKSKTGHVGLPAEGSRDLKKACCCSR